MTKEERLQVKIANQERIVLSYGSEFIKIILILISIISLLIGSMVFYHFKISAITAGVSALLFTTYWIFFQNVKKYVSASIKGEMLITQDVFNTNKITSLKSIKAISSITILGINYTKVTYKLDGTKYNVRMVKKLDKSQLENEEIIKTALKAAC